jgi:hypothetical protein
MAKHLKQNDVDTIVEVIRAWPSDKITWEMICEHVAGVIGNRPTRQTLNAHFQIKAAFAAKKGGLKIHGPRTAMPSSLAVAAQRIARQRSEIDELQTRNARLLEQFVKWQYNAYKRGMTEDQLNQPLPRIDRERTDRKTSTELENAR